MLLVVDRSYLRTRVPTYLRAQPIDAGASQERRRGRFIGMSASKSASEGPALLVALSEVPPSARTACEGWTAHHIAAHLAAGAKEVADLVEERLEGRPERPTRGFEEREAPFRALHHDQLLEQLVSHNKRKLAAYEELTQRDDPSIAFTGTRLSVDELETHSRSEAAIHRWDLVGDDDTATELLAQPEVTTHAVKVLNAMPVLNESARSLGQRAVESGNDIVRVVLRSAGQPDVLFVVTAQGSKLEMADRQVDDADADVTSDAAQRLLTLWGRRSSERPVHAHGDPAVVRAFEHTFWPHAQPWGRRSS